jgi:hypothetical protein
VTSFAGQIHLAPEHRLNALHLHEALPDLVQFHAKEAQWYGQNSDECQ